jgi:hypothetical protein
MASTRKLAAKIRKHQRALAAGRRGYAKADEIFEEILKDMKPGQAVKIAKDRVATLKDNFVEKDGTLKNKVYRSHGISHYELAVETTP